MKKLIIILLLMGYNIYLISQTIKQKLGLYAKHAPYYFVTGMADGMNQTLLFHYDSFKAVHPNANDQYWNPQISWVNKGDTFIMRTALVGFTDGYHLTRTIGRTSMRANSMFNDRISLPKQKWYWYPIDFICLFTIESLGFHSVYSYAYK